MIFDFDGLILDTETPEFRSWQGMYREHGFELSHEKWGTIVGGNGHSDFDAAEQLSRLTQGQLDAASLRARNRLESHEIILTQGPLPGVRDYLHEAKRLGLKLAIASSSDRAWVYSHAERIGVLDHFDQVITAEDVGIGRTKPNPDLFLTALSRLGVPKEAAIVFEDSPNGVKAAKRAGIFVVAIPNDVTSGLSIEGADLILSTLSDMPLSALIDKVK
ncbi:MAG TPA: HAD family hydrolase [Anaerolineales bacterium]|nr:HAD family hydrolase [Anaerolineales bacterium]